MPIPKFEFDPDDAPEIQAVLEKARVHLEKAEEILDEAGKLKAVTLAHAHSAQAHALLMYGVMMGVLANGD